MAAVTHRRLASAYLPGARSWATGPTLPGHTNVNVPPEPPALPLLARPAPSAGPWAVVLAECGTRARWRRHGPSSCLGPLPPHPPLPRNTLSTAGTRRPPGHTGRRWGNGQSPGRGRGPEHAAESRGSGARPREGSQGCRALASALCPACLAPEPGSPPVSGPSCLPLAALGPG